MQQNYQDTFFPTTSSAPVGTGGAQWNDPTNIYADDSSVAWLGLAGSGSATLYAGGFGISLPPGAVVDGIGVFFDSPFQNGGWLIIMAGLDNIGAPDSKDALTVHGMKGGPTDLWGAESIDPADLENLQVQLYANGTVDDNIDLNYISVTVYWHFDLNQAPSDVPTRIAYKTYSREGEFLGELPNVTSPFAFAQDKNSVASSIDVVCGIKPENTMEVEPLLNESEDIIEGNDGQPILSSKTKIILAPGDSEDNAIFKNSNRVKVWMYNYWYPNGKLMFSGQMNKVRFKAKGSGDYVKLTVLSDGFDMQHLIARGYPFSYTLDVNQASQNGYVTVSQGSGKTAGRYTRYGQSFYTGAISNLGAITLKLYGSATVTVTLYDSANGNVVGSVSKAVSLGAATDVQFQFPQLLTVDASTQYFFAVSVNAGKSIRVYKHGTSATYANGTMYTATYAGGSGGGSYAPSSGDFYFKTYSGTPTTTTTYSSQDPVTGMMSGILADYNDRGGYIRERNFDATGLSLTNVFNQSTINDALETVLKMSPHGFSAYVDLGTSEIDITQTSTDADFTIVKGKHPNDFELEYSIDQVKNRLLFTGGEVTPGVNLYKDYKDSQSDALYGPRMATQSDNRVTNSTTASAIGTSFIEEYSDETQEATLVISSKVMDTTLLTPNKTIGFAGYKFNMVDDLVLEIVRREFNPSFVTLTVGRLPIRLSDTIQKIQRSLLDEQTVNNPSNPT